MNYIEREAHKESARKLLFEATTTAQRAHAVFMFIEAHYYRNPQAPNLKTYASHWLWASQRRKDIPADALTLLIQLFPPPRRAKIQMGFSDWGSYGDPNYGL